jgi:hypothetical protein
MNGDVTERLVDTALIGAVYERDRLFPRALEMVRALCHPWLEPSDAFLVARAEVGLRQKWMVLAQAERDLAATADGRRYFEGELCRPLGPACHQHRFLQEQLRLCFIGQLSPQRRLLLATQMRQDRRRCLVCLGTRLEALPDGPERRLIRARRQLMEEEALALDRRLVDLGVLDQVRL